jgi:hypothetical protein
VSPHPYGEQASDINRTVSNSFPLKSKSIDSPSYTIQSKKNSCRCSLLLVAKRQADTMEDVKRTIVELEKKVAVIKDILSANVAQKTSPCCWPVASTNFPMELRKKVNECLEDRHSR